MTERTQPNPKGLTSYRFSGATKERIKFLSEHHVRSRTNVLEWLVNQEYQRLQREQGETL